MFILKQSGCVHKPVPTAGPAHKIKRCTWNQPAACDDDDPSRFRKKRTYRQCSRLKEIQERLRNAAHLIFVTDFGSKSARRSREDHVVRVRRAREAGSTVVRRPALLVKEATLARSLLAATAFLSRARRRPTPRLRINERRARTLALSFPSLCALSPLRLCFLKL